MAVRVISFDADGTLLTLDFSLAVWMEGIPRRLAQRRRITYEEAREEVFRRYREMGEEDYRWFDIAFWSKEFDLGEPIRLMEPYIDRISLFPEVEEVLESLDGKYRLIVSSNSPREILETELKDHLHRFERVISAPSDFRMKKSPEYFRKVCDLLQIEPEEMVHVGDRHHDDFLAAKKAGVRSFHLDRENGSGPHRVRDLIDFLQRLKEFRD